MTNSQIEAVTIKLQEVIKLLGTLLNESLALQERDRQQNEAKEIMLRKETAINKKEALANRINSDTATRMSALEEERKQLTEDRHNLNHKDFEIEERMKKLKEMEQRLEDKKMELAVLEERERELDKRETEFTSKLQDVAVREANILKEAKIDRERKERLNAFEEELKRKQLKLQRFLNE